MSKAFTREDDAPQPTAGPAPIRLAPGEKRYVTPEGFERLRRELDSLQPRRKEPEAARRIAYLTSLLDALTVVPPATEPLERVVFGARVELVDENARPVSYRIVGPDEADPSAGAISVDSPLARALLGKKVGDIVEVQRPRGAIEYTIVAVR